MKINGEQTLNVTVDDEGRQKLCISFPNSKSTQSCQGKVEDTEYQMTSEQIRFYACINDGNDRNHGLKKIRSRQSSGCYFDNFEDLVSIIVVEPRQKNNAEGEEQHCDDRKMSQVWEQCGVKSQGYNNYDCVQN